MEMGGGGEIFIHLKSGLPYYSVPKSTMMTSLNIALMIDEYSFDIIE